jgi:hypothetical protein
MFKDIEMLKDIEMFKDIVVLGSGQMSLLRPHLLKGGYP